MHQYNWKIDSVDNGNRTMIVQFSHGEDVSLLNLPMPPADGDLATWIDRYAPVERWKSQLHSGGDVVAIGTEGTGTFDITASSEPAVVPAVPQMANSMNEEYIRALIYQVLEEIKEAQV